MVSLTSATICQAPDLEGFVDQDILDRFKNTNVMYGDIINAQLIKTNRELLEAINNLKSSSNLNWETGPR